MGFAKRTTKGIPVATVDDLFPWEPAPRSVEDTIALLQSDFAYAVTHTAVVVHSNNPALVFTANTHRGQLVPRGEVRFFDPNGLTTTTIELQDIGMPQVNAQYMTVQQIMSRVWKLASELGLELVK
jgi:hypothetical protein